MYNKVVCCKQTSKIKYMRKESKLQNNIKYGEKDIFLKTNTLETEKVQRYGYGTLEGMMKMTDDFNAPLEEFEEYQEKDKFKEIGYIKNENNLCKL